MLPAIDNLDKVEKNRSIQAALVVYLAEQLYTRENGHPPDSPQQLVGPYLKALPEGFVMPADDPARAK